jgi:Ser/Thr protein kinase RdoA (MazF antagonist)
MAPVVGPDAGLLDRLGTELDRDRVNALVAPLGAGAVIAINPLHGGSSPVFKLDLADGAALVLKVFLDGATPDNETFAARHLRNAGIPVTRRLLLDQSRTHFPFSLTVSNYLPGATVGTFAAHPDIATAYRQMGAMLRSLHAVGMPAYGRFNDTGIADPLASNDDFVADLLNHAFERFAHYGADPALVRRLRRVADAAFPGVVPYSSGPVFAHDDFHPNNVLAVEVDGKLILSGLIDFGNAHAADPVCDLAKCLFCSEHEAPGSTSQLLEGYGPVDHPRPQAALDFYTLLHRVIMWWWLRHIGVLPTPDSPTDLMDALRRTAAGP